MSHVKTPLKTSLFARSFFILLDFIFWLDFIFQWLFNWLIYSYNQIA